MKNEPIYVELENTPIWKKSNPSQPFLFKNIQKHIFPAFRLESWTDYLDLLEWKPIKKQIKEMIFRGQIDANWELESSLSRINKNYSDKPIEYNLTQEVIDLQLATFKENFKKDLPDELLWAIGQHHGLWTPYLDWTTSFKVALYFGIQSYSPQSKIKYFSISILNKSKVTDKQLRNIIIKEQHELNLNDSPLTQRINNQYGCFTQTVSKPTIEGIVTDDHEKESNYFYKIFIKNKDIQSCREYLLNNEIDIRYIFPDLEGVVNYCNNRIATKAVSFGGGQVIKIEQTILNSKELENTKELLSKFLDKNSSCDLSAIAQDINKLQFKIEKILLCNGYPYEKIKPFLKAYLNN